METVTFASEGHKLRGALFPTSVPASSAVVLCHGAFERKENWFSFAQRLAEAGLPAFTFDFVGHGASEGLRSTVQMRSWSYNIRDALSYLGQRGYHHFALVGWDSGGSAVVLAAAHDPRARCAVVLSAPILLIPSLSSRVVLGLALGVDQIVRRVWKKPLTLSRVNEFEALRVASDDGVNARFLADPQVQAHLQAVPVREGMDSSWCDITRAAEKVRVPMLVVHGTEDKVNKLQQSQKLCSVVQGPVELQMLEGSGHAIHLDAERDIAYEMIARWLSVYLPRQG